ncbi:MAG: pantoate--beta-alanine ligase [Methylococcaceae bacterium]|nr:pantoate--beta-alanine ligase [Methylococcaceae bacterium]
MDVIETIDTLRLRLAEWRAASERIVLVPTMGNLHDGHLKLVEEASRNGQRVVVSIFVNPAQFGAGEDFLAYPRTLDEDIRRLRESPVDLLFAPANEEVYPVGSLTCVTVPELSDLLCGEFRPGHFTGVATVVLKLFNMVRPDVAVFGEKDFQQLLIIRRMVADLNVPVVVKSVETVREPDGLAMSSRNRYLSEEQRKLAPNLYAVLREAAGQILAGIGSFDELERRQTAKLRASGFRPDYFSIRKASDLRPARALDRELVILAAAWLGKARLIDNQIVCLE